MYTRANVNKTLDRAIEFLKAGWTKGVWQCHLDVNGVEICSNISIKDARKFGKLASTQSCAQGAVELALGGGHRSGSFFVDGRYENGVYVPAHINALGKYNKFLINRLNRASFLISNGKVNSVMELNDRHGSTLDEVLSAFNVAKEIR